MMIGVYTVPMALTRSELVDDSPPRGARGATGDEEAFEALVRQHWESVARFLWLRLSAEDAHDMAQDVFLRAWRAHRDGRGPAEDRPAAWRAYLQRTARNLWIDDARRRGARIEAVSLDGLLDEEGSWEERVHPGAPGEADGAAMLVERETRVALVDCLGRLDRDVRQIFWAHYVEARTKREIARSLDCPESTLRLEMVKGMGALRRCLEEKGQAPEHTP